MSIVALSETTGSLGNEIGRQLSQTLGYEFADREIIAKAAERFGENVLELAHVTEERPTLWERLSDTKRRYLAAVEATLLEMATHDNVILSGRGVTVLLSKARHALRVRITAPEVVRAERIRQRDGLTPAAALDLVRHTDRERAARMRFLYHVDWDDPLLYDLVLNTERLDASRGARLIAETLADERYRSTAESRRELIDRCVVSQIRAALLTSPTLRDLQIVATSKDGRVSMSGRVDSPEQRAAVRRLAEHTPGVTDVLDEMVVFRPGHRPRPEV